MRIGTFLSTLAGLLFAGLAAPALADHAPSYAVPGRGMPPSMHATGTVVGDWGLYRPGHMAPYLIEPPYPTHVPGHAMRYFPADGRVRPVGRYEVPDGVRHPVPPPKHRRTWQTAPLPVAPVDGTWLAPLYAPEIHVPIEVRPRR
jgi:hypothetical protein